MSETLKEKESKFFEFLKTLSPTEKTHMRTYLNEGFMASSLAQTF